MQQVQNDIKLVKSLQKKTCLPTGYFVKADEQRSVSLSSCRHHSTALKIS